jgi:hypothetical protein
VSLTLDAGQLTAPEPFLEVHLHEVQLVPTLCGACVGYEQGRWRAEEFAAHVMEWLPEFALTASEWKGLGHANAVQLLRKAARTVYSTDKFKARGEFGELILHALVRQVHKSNPAISKIYYKTAPNETVKGFDAVHVVGPPENMELWLGEAKFYSNISKAIADVVAELEAHCATDYLRTEFLLLAGKLDSELPHAEKLRTLFSQNISLDRVFTRLCIPVLLTYDSPCVQSHTACDNEYLESFTSELETHYKSFATKLGATNIPGDVRVHLLLLPMHTKTILIDHLDRSLRAWQSL